MADTTPAVPSEQDLRERLRDFFTYNELASLEVGATDIVVRDPWGDDTVIIRIAGDIEKTIEVLNALILPRLFSAIYHRDTRDLEFIYLPRKAETHGRKFDFNFRGRALQCEFADTSERLRNLASQVRPVAPPSHTDHRNLGLFSVGRLTMAKDSESLGTSFWIRGIDWDEASLLELTRNLNFYMWYFDRESPKIRIHERSKLELPGKAPRYLFDAFPGVVSARPLDTFLLQLWESFVSGNAVHRVLYGYQIIEYTAFYHLQESILQTVRRVLLAPETLERSGEATRQILEAVADDKMEDAAKIEKVVELYAHHEQLAESIVRNRAYFSEDVTFDGGFVLSALCSAQWGPKDVKECKDMSRRVANSFRKVRNAIAHSREARNTNSISPTLANQDRIYPWLDPLSILVSNLMFYRNTDI